MPAVWEVTNDGLAIVRLHGRNHETWNAKDAKAASDRFNYDYSDEELAELAEKIRIIASQVSRTHVIFNNNYLYTVMLPSVRWLALDAQLRRGPASGGLAPYVGHSSTRFCRSPCYDPPGAFQRHIGHSRSEFPDERTRKAGPGGFLLRAA